MEKFEYLKRAKENLIGCFLTNLQELEDSLEVAQCTGTNDAEVCLLGSATSVEHP